MKNNKKLKALISLSDKTGLSKLCKVLIHNNVEIISTGGTYDYITKKLKHKATQVSEITQSPEILEGRVKTLHPSIYGGLLALRNNKKHFSEIAKHNIERIDFIFINFYPFEKIVSKKSSSVSTVIEHIDIGGPSLIRAGAKNFYSVCVITDVADYELFIKETKNQYLDQLTSLEFRKRMAAKAFRRCAEYDTYISNYFDKTLSNDFFPEKITFSYQKKQDLRYGENPSQRAAFYTEHSQLTYSIANCEQLHGKELSYNNIQDSNVALDIISEFNEPSVVSVKHLNPCGFGMGKNIYIAWKRAFDADTISIFGGIVASNRQVDEKTAKAMSAIFLEIILAPSFSTKALTILSNKKNIRLLQYKQKPKKSFDQQLISSVKGGVLIQSNFPSSNRKAKWEVVTKKKPTKAQMSDLTFAWKLVKHVKSNAILLFAKDKTTGIGAGQMNRVGSVKIALDQARDKASKSVLASDAFFPLPDSILTAAKAGIKAIIQPGGSIKDGLSIKACDDYGISMVFTHERAFKH